MVITAGPNTKKITVREWNQAEAEGNLYDLMASRGYLFDGEPKSAEVTEDNEHE